MQEIFTCSECCNLCSCHTEHMPIIILRRQIVVSDFARVEETVHEKASEGSNNLVGQVEVYTVIANDNLRLLVEK